jgi:hypothetical protein
MKDQFSQPALTVDAIASGLTGEGGFVPVSSPQLRSLVGALALEGWADFAASWDNLEIDRFMADGGRFRRRRFALFSASGGRITRKPHAPHFQSRDYNPLNGGIDRWFEPVTDTIAAHPVTERLLALCDEAFTRAAGGDPRDARWHVEMHQFRIEPTQREAGKPTPEGMHRDGVDWVFVGLVARTGVAGGITGIGDARGRSLGSFTLSEPLDSVFLDDHRVRHGVTPIEVLDPGRPAHRDVLVLTFRKDA